MKLIRMSGAWVAGVAFGLFVDPPFASLALLFAAALLLGCLLRSLRMSLMPALLALLFAAGLLRADVPEGVGSELAALHGGGPVDVIGVVVSDPQPARSATQFRLRVDRVGRPAEASAPPEVILVTAHSSPELARERERPFFRYGDRLLLEGRLSPPSEIEGFDYATYLARQGIDTVMSFPRAALLSEGHGSLFYRGLHSARRRLSTSIAESLPEPQASIGQALLLGLRHNLSDDTVAAFRFTGASHMLAISGLHVGVLLGVSIAVSQAVLGRYRQLYLAAPLAAVWGYTLLAGAPPSAVRAAAMGTVFLAALALGRPRSTTTSLAFAAAVMVAIAPELLRSLSFQLSFAAMAGIALWSEPLAAILGGRDAAAAADSQDGPGWPRRIAAQSAAATIAATAATLPLAAFYFERVPLVGLPVTLLSLPAVPAAVVTQGLTALAGLWGGAAATPFAWAAWLVTGYVDFVVQMFSRLPAASIETGRVAPALVFAYYGALAAAHVWAARLLNLRFRRLRPAMAPPPLAPGLRLAGWTAIAMMAAAGLLCLAALLSRPDGRLSVAMLDVGQGDAILLTTPTGGQVLVDGGQDPALLADLLGQRMPYRDRTIELVVLTHPHSDHVAGLTEAMRRYEVTRVIERIVDYDSADYAEWRRVVAAEGADVVNAQAGLTIDLGGGAYARVFSPPRQEAGDAPLAVNDASIALRIVYGGVSFVLTGDMFSRAERAAIRSGALLDSDVLKVAHHGSRTSSSSAFLRAVSPSVAVISAGDGNQHGHPHEEVVDRLLRHVREDLLFTTAAAGTVEFITDGEQITIRTSQ